MNNNEPFLLQAGRYIIKFLGTTLIISALSTLGLSFTSYGSIIEKFFTITFLLWIGGFLIYLPISFYKIKNAADFNKLNDFRKAATISCIGGGITIFLKSLNYIIENRFIFITSSFSWLIFILYVIWTVSGLLAPIVYKILIKYLNKKDDNDMDKGYEKDSCCLCGKTVNRKDKYKTFIDFRGNAICDDCYRDLYEERFSKRGSTDE